MKFKIILVTILLFVSATLTSSFAQQDSQFTQYMYNTSVINPAYAGSRGVLSVNSLYRTQWVGLEGAPKALTASVNSPVRDGSPIGLGINFIKDEIGPTSESNLTADFSYTIPVSDRAKLAFGLKAGFNLLDVDFSKLTYNPSDPNAVSIRNQFSPAIGLGIMLHDNETWYVGVSVPNFIETDHYEDNILVTSRASERSNFYFIGGYVIDLNPTIKFKPAFLAKGGVGSPTAIDLSANFLFNQKFTLGVAHRLEAAVSALVGFQVNRNIMIGYAYDHDTTELSTYNSGSHELFLRFELSKEMVKLITPRFF